MENIKYKRKNTQSYMVLELWEKDNGFESTMLEVNPIDVLLKRNEIQVNGIVQCWYDITGKESLKDYLIQEDLTDEILRKIIIYINRAFEQLNKYLISQNHILISPETIYLDRDDNKFGIYLCYFPVDNGDANEQFRSVLEFLLSQTNSDNSELANLCFKLYDISMKDDYSLKELIECINAQDHTEDEIVVEKIDLRELDELDEDKEEEHISFFSRIIGKIQELLIKEEHQEEYEYEDLVFEPDAEAYEPTVLLKEEDKEIAGKLVYDGRRGEENFLITSDSFTIGNVRGKNDACLKSQAVSKHHAKIIKDESGYYISDLNSTNGTYLNGRILNYSEQKKLSAMDEIMFGDVAYVFM